MLELAWLLHVLLRAVASTVSNGQALILDTGSTTSSHSNSNGNNDNGSAVCENGAPISGKSLLQQRLVQSPMSLSKIVSSKDGENSEMILGLTPTITNFRLPGSWSHFAEIYRQSTTHKETGAIAFNQASRETKLKYLSWVYHQEITDETLWDDLEMFYTKSGILKPEDLPSEHLRDQMEAFNADSTNGPPYIVAADKVLSRRQARDNTWLEVIRESIHDVGEGTGWANSCWFYVFKGSGIFVNVGNTLVFNTHQDAVQMIKDEIPEWKELWEDAVYAKYAERKGLDTIQTLRAKAWDSFNPELIYLGGPCKTTKVSTGCVHGLEFKTGVNANRPCSCVDIVEDLSNCPTNATDRKKCKDLLNCGG